LSENGNVADGAQGRGETAKGDGLEEFFTIHFHG
jgi:hypothetical protein